MQTSDFLRAKDDCVVGGRIATTRKRAGRVVVRVTVGVRTGLLEECRIVFGPRAALTGGRGFVGTSAAVSVRVEPLTGALARHHTGASLDGQLGRTHAVQVGYAAGRFAVVLALFRVRELPGRQHPDRQVVAVYQRNVVEV